MHSGQVQTKPSRRKIKLDNLLRIKNEYQNCKTMSVHHFIKEKYAIPFELKKINLNPTDYSRINYKSFHIFSPQIYDVIECGWWINFFELIYK